jgi:sortase A
MIKNSKRVRNISIIIIVILIYLSINFFLIYNFYQNENIESNFILKESETAPVENTITYNIKNAENETIIGNQYKSNNWRIKIQKINLDAPIIDGVEQEVLRRGVGHFKESSIFNGNVCLAAHNRGYKYNYFQNIKNLEIGDIITYETTYGTKQYKVEINTVIKETDWSYLEDTKENKITLITCEENMKEYRRCIQATEF